MPVKFYIDLADRIKPVLSLRDKKFIAKISIPKLTAAISEAKRNKSDLALWLGKSRFESGKRNTIVI